MTEIDSERRRIRITTCGQEIIDHSEIIRDLECKVAAFTWTQINDEDLPADGDEVWGPARQILAVRPDLLVVLGHTAQGWLMNGYTHKRPINPPGEVK